MKAMASGQHLEPSRRCRLPPRLDGRENQQDKDEQESAHEQNLTSSSLHVNAFDQQAWRAEVMAHEELFLDLHDRLPKELIYERELLICRM